jgi:hypothetical protein
MEFLEAQESVSVIIYKDNEDAESSAGKGIKIAEKLQIMEVLASPAGFEPPTPPGADQGSRVRCLSGRAIGSGNLCRG